MANSMPPSPASQQPVALRGEGGAKFATHFQSTRMNCNEEFELKSKFAFIRRRIMSPLSTTVIISAYFVFVTSYYIHADIV
jgi:hypothetical protein